MGLPECLYDDSRHMTPSQLNSEIRAAFAEAARYLTAVTAAGSPGDSPAELLTRPDVDAQLKDALDQARQLAQDAVQEAWAGVPSGQYLQWLLADVARSYDSLSVLRAAIRTAWHTETDPLARASAVQLQVIAHGALLALRSEMSAHGAAIASGTAAQIAAGEQLELAGEQVWKVWHCSRRPPDERTCHWCKALNGMALPLGADFPAGEPADLTGHGNLTQPPRLYHGVLPGPPRHPRCRCRIVIIKHLPEQQVSSQRGGQEAAAAESSPDLGSGAGEPILRPVFLAASDIRAMPEAKYKSMLAFLQEAAGQLRQALARLKKAVIGS